MMNRIWGVTDKTIPAIGTLEEYVRYRGWWRDTGVALEPEDWATSRARQNGETVIGDLIDIRRFDEQIATTGISAVPLYDHDGCLSGAVAVMQDVTRQQQMKMTLREHEERDRTRYHKLPRALNRTGYRRSKKIHFLSIDKRKERH